MDRVENNQENVAKKHEAGFKYLTFNIAGETYGVAISLVTEIVGIQTITKLPKQEDYIGGVINLRGKIIPVVEARLRFGLEQIDYTDRTCILIINYKNEQIGIIADSISEVVNVKSSEISPKSKIEKKPAEKFIWGLAMTEKKVVIILNIEKFLYHERKIL